MKKIKLFLLLMSMTFSGLAQQQLADSIQEVLKQSLPDSTRAYNMVMLAMYTEPLDMQKAHTLYKEAVDYSLSKNLDYYGGLALYYEATPYHFNGEYVQQYNNLVKAINLLSNSNHYKARSQLGIVYGGLSGYYRSIEKYDSAVVASLKSIAIQEEFKKYRGLAISCMNLAMIYQQLKLPQKQKEYADKGLVNARITNENDILMMALLQQAHYFTEINDFTKAKIYVDSASVYYSDNFEFSRKQSYFLHKANTYQNLNQFDSAVYYFRKCHDLAKSINSRWNMTEPLMQIGYIYLQQKNYTEAERYLKMGLEIAEKDSILTFMKEGYESLSKVHAATGNYKEAFGLLQKYNAIKDSIQSEDRKKFVLDLEKKYETEKKDTQARLQELEITKRKSITHGLLVITSTVIIILILVLRNFRQRNHLQTEKIKKLETEKQLMATEAVLQGEEQERTRLAKDLHDGLGGLLSGIKYSLITMKENLIMTPDNAQAFERSLDMLDTSIHEMRRVAHNLMPENLLKFGLNTALRDFCSAIYGTGILNLKYQSYGIESESFDQKISISVYRIVQELVTNIVKHANARVAHVQVSFSNKTLLIDVEDDGKGLDVSDLKSKKGIGWSNIYSRIEYLNGKLDIQSQPDKGTSIHIELEIE